MADARTLAELIRGQLGVNTIPRENQVTSTVGATVQTILRQDGARVVWIAVNLSPNRIYILHRNTVSSTLGLLLAPNGGTITAIWNEDFHLVEYEWFGIADAAGSNVLLLELLAAPLGPSLS